MSSFQLIEDLEKCIFNLKNDVYSEEEIFIMSPIINAIKNSEFPVLNDSSIHYLYLGMYVNKLFRKSILNK